MRSVVLPLAALLLLLLQPQLGACDVACTPLVDSPDKANCSGVVYDLTQFVSSSGAEN